MRRSSIAKFRRGLLYPERDRSFHSPDSRTIPGPARGIALFKKAVARFRPHDRISVAGIGSSFGAWLPLQQPVETGVFDLGKS
jgi:hypothetical protein